MRSVIQPSSSSSWYDIVFCKRIFVLYIKNIVPIFYEVVNCKNCNSVKKCISGLCGGDIKRTLDGMRWHDGTNNICAVDDRRGTGSFFSRASVDRERGDVSFFAGSLAIVFFEPCCCMV